jgi:hypothetical protein
MIASVTLSKWKVVQCKGKREVVQCKGKFQKIMKEGHIYEFLVILDPEYDKV